MSSKVWALIVLIAISAGWMFRYDTTAAGDNTLILNRWSGDMRVVKENGKASPVNPDVSGTQMPEFKTLSDVPPKGVELTLKAKWRSGKMNYIFMASPATEELVRLRNQGGYSGYKYTITLLDKDRFPVTEITIPFNTLTEIVDTETGKPKAYMAYAAIDMAKDEFGDISDWTVGWNFPTK